MDSLEKHIIECPFCQTKFHISTALLKERRRVKCSKCENTWFQEAIVCEEKKDTSISSEMLSPIRVIPNESRKKEQITPPPSLDKQMGSPMDDEKDSSSKRHFSFLVFVIPFLAFFFARDYLIQVIPALSGIYRVMGLSLKDTENSFEVRDTAWHEVVDKGIPSIVVSGNLANMSSQLKTSPALRITLRGRGGCHPMDFASYVFGDDKAEGPDGLCIVDQWSLNVSYDRLLPGQVVPFSTVHPYDERQQVEKVQIDFVE
jgi:predicted Zn finger-like uncharacterized protein